MHGDLHCEHICYAPEGIQIFDCVEFSAKLRSCDLASELAFLLMDLEHRDAGALGDAFLSRYRGWVNDPELAPLLPFYQCYRAIVRGQVEALRPQGNAREAFRYFRLAARLAQS